MEMVEEWHPRIGRISPEVQRGGVSGLGPGAPKMPSQREDMGPQSRNVRDNPQGPDDLNAMLHSTNASESDTSRVNE
jgi:hypothetical protein